MASIKPVVQLVPDDTSFMQLVHRAHQAAVQAKDDPFAVVTAFLYVFQLKDWRKGGDKRFWASCPFAQTIAEVANGLKHLELHNPRLTADPHVAGISPQMIGGSGMCGWGPIGSGPIGSGGEFELQIRTRRTASDPEQFHSSLLILFEAIQWWRQDFVDHP